MVATPAAIRNFQRDLLAWFDVHARDLPWRRSDDPYRIWISEIMLQQTRVTAVLDYYARFITLFPSLAALAVAREPDVLAAWSGLGYYRRAKMMHKAAQVVVLEHQGVLPRTAEALRKLPGIGEYTSSAIASIAFGEPVAVIDGNVERVLLRIFSQEDEPATPTAPEKWLRGRAASLVYVQRPGDFNQSMMELGATICLPQRPLCLQCPVQQFCATRGEHQAPPPKKMHSRQIAYALLCRNRSRATQVLLEQRPLSASLMPGMWELPEVAMEPSDEDRIEITLRHAITVTNYQVHVLRFSQEEATRRWPVRGHPRRWARSSELGSLPLTGLTRKVLQRLHIMTNNQGVAAAKSDPALLEFREVR
jgi:A/G-specific adenine glycosylase